MSNFFLNEAFDLIGLKKKEMASIALYNAAFHSARAVLFMGGLKEKSHYCLQKYLEYKSQKEKEITLEEVALFDSLRGIRQEVQYNLTKIRFKEDLNVLYNKTEEFIEKTTSIITKEQPL